MHKNGRILHLRAPHRGGGRIEAPKTRPSGLLRVGVAESDRPLWAQAPQRRLGRRRVVENLLRHGENGGPPQIFHLRPLGPYPGVNRAVHCRLKGLNRGRRPLSLFGLTSRDHSSRPNSAGSGRRAHLYGACRSGDSVSWDKTSKLFSCRLCPGEQGNRMYGHRWPQSGWGERLCCESCRSGGRRHPGRPSGPHRSITAERDSGSGQQRDGKQHRSSARPGEGATAEWRRVPKWQVGRRRWLGGCPGGERKHGNPSVPSRQRRCRTTRGRHQCIVGCLASGRFGQGHTNRRRAHGALGVGGGGRSDQRSEIRAGDVRAMQRRMHDHCPSVVERRQPLSRSQRLIPPRGRAHCRTCGRHSAEVWLAAALNRGLDHSKIVRPIQTVQNVLSGGYGPSLGLPSAKVRNRGRQVNLQATANGIARSQSRQSPGGRARGEVAVRSFRSGRGRRRRLGRCHTPRRAPSPPPLPHSGA